MIEKILFIMPSKNRQTITRAVNSLKQQTNDRWHLCIVYDDVISPIIQAEKQITCINTNQKLGIGVNGAGNVRNVAIDKYIDQYEWIGFLDDDDRLSYNYVDLLYSKYSHHDLVVFRMKKHNQIIPDINKKTLDQCDVGISFCYKSKFNKLRFKPGHLEDFVFLQDFQKQSKQYIITEEIGYYVRDTHE